MRAQASRIGHEDDRRRVGGLRVEAALHRGTQADREKVARERVRTVGSCLRPCGRVVALRLDGKSEVQALHGTQPVPVSPGFPALNG